MAHFIPLRWDICRVQPTHQHARPGSIASSWRSSSHPHALQHAPKHEPPHAPQRRNNVRNNLRDIKRIDSLHIEPECT